jgi:hypothetical protein
LEGHVNVKPIAVAGVAIAVVIAVAAFNVGYKAGGGGQLQVPILVADGYVGADQASFQVGDITYGFQSTVEWTDSSGSMHEDGWPDCLPRLQQVKGLRIAAGIIYLGDTGTGEARVVWVDCRGR